MLFNEFSYSIKEKNILPISSKLQAFLITLFLVVTGFISGCDLTGNNEPTVTYEADFREDETLNWEPFYTGYPVSYEGNMGFDHGLRTLPEPLNTTEQGYYITAFNRSDNVKMLFRNKIDALQPNTTYRVQFTVRFATETPSGCLGTGGAPGESVKVIADASNVRPEPIIDGEGEDEYYLLNTQYMGDSQDWYQNAIMGDISNSRECEDGYEYEIKEVSSDRYHTTVTSDEDGEAWLLFGTRSGFESQTELFYTYIKADFIR